MKLISIVLPALNESKNLPLLIPEIIKVLPKKYSYEIICVDDGSTDGTSEAVAKVIAKNRKVRLIQFHRRFGHQAALRAGLSKARGDAVITMDSDFQHPPKVILNFIKKWEQGFDLVQGKKKVDTTVNFLKKKQRDLGYFVWRYASDGILQPGVSDFRLMDKHIVNYIKRSREHEFFLRGLVMLASHNPTTIEYSVAKRKHGRSSYSMKMFINMFVNGFITFSTKPLRVASIIGVSLFLFSAVYLVIDIVRAIVLNQKIIEGWTTAVILIALLNGILFMYLGILGEYISVIFKEVKNRPIYQIKRKVNM